MPQPVSSPRCAECGWSLPGVTCVACGASARPSSTTAEAPEARIEAAALLALHEEDYPRLADAFAAFRARDWLRFVSLCLHAVGVGRPYSAEQGGSHYWVFTQRLAVIIISVDRAAGTLAIDAPVVSIRPETEAALLRAALSGVATLGASRAARRGNRLLLTMTHRLEALPPPRLVNAIDEIADVASAIDHSYAFQFGVSLLGPPMRKGHIFDLALAGQPRRLQMLSAVNQPVTLRPGGRAPAPSGATPVVTAADLNGFLEILREAQQLTIALGVAPAQVDGEVAIHVSFALRAAFAAGLELDAARLLLALALQVRSGATLPHTIRNVYRRLLQDRGHSSPQPPVAWPRLTGGARAMLQSTVAAASAARTTVGRRTVLLGGLCEVMLFADLNAPTIARLREIHDAAQGTDSATVNALLTRMEGMCR